MRLLRTKARKFADRYGAAGAATVVLATLALATVPVPGLAFLPVTLAELVRQKRRKPFGRLALVNGRR